MRNLLIGLVLLAVGLLAGRYLFQTTSQAGCNPLEVNVNRDSSGHYTLSPNHKTRHLSLSTHDMVVWTFDADSTIDSVTAVFSGSTPFAASHFEFADSAAFSGMPVVAAGPATYPYVITIYPSGAPPDTVDPGIIIDM